MAKVFNVDAIAEESREIVLAGKTHQIVPMSVTGFLATMEQASQLQDENTPQSQVRAIVKTVARAIPTLTEEELSAIPMEQLTAIAQFIRGEVPDALKPSIATPEEAEEAKND